MKSKLNVMFTQLLYSEIGELILSRQGEAAEECSAEEIKECDQILQRLFADAPKYGEACVEEWRAKLLQISLPELDTTAKIKMCRLHHLYYVQFVNRALSTMADTDINNEPATKPLNDQPQDSVDSQCLMGSAEITDESNSLEPLPEDQQNDSSDSQAESTGMAIGVSLGNEQGKLPDSQCQDSEGITALAQGLKDFLASCVDRATFHEWFTCEASLTTIRALFYCLPDGQVRSLIGEFKDKKFGVFEQCSLLIQAMIFGYSKEDTAAVKYKSFNEKWVGCMSNKNSSLIYRYRLLNQSIKNMDSNRNSEVQKLDATEKQAAKLLRRNILHGDDEEKEQAINEWARKLQFFAKLWKDTTIGVEYRIELCNKHQHYVLYVIREAFCVVEVAQRNDANSTHTE
ncbi:hypothetical protein Ciccas_007579 [Cichlidogyrus casuarinus]|uniref:Uncharacterized protein n=1 Tax=Cichlidogyrus casuarinus TaxID=1844966 RepID=A0ABD2Q2I1_9PLAT